MSGTTEQLSRLIEAAPDYNCAELEYPAAEFIQAVNCVMTRGSFDDEDKVTMAAFIGRAHGRTRAFRCGYASIAADIRQREGTIEKPAGSDQKFGRYRMQRLIANWTARMTESAVILVERGGFDKVKRINRASLWRFDPTVFEQVIRKARLRSEYEIKPWEAMERAASIVAHFYVREIASTAEPEVKPTRIPDATSVEVGLEKKLIRYLKQFRTEYAIALKSKGYDDIDVAARIDRLLDQAKVVLNKNRQVKIWKRLKRRAVAAPDNGGRGLWQNPPLGDFSCPSDENTITSEPETLQNSYAHDVSKESPYKNTPSGNDNKGPKQKYQFEPDPDAGERNLN